MTDEIHDQMHDGDGKPVFNEDGTPATFFDIMALAGERAAKLGVQLNVITDSTGDRAYGLSGPVIDQIRAHRAATGCGLQEALTALGITWKHN